MRLLQLDEHGNFSPTKDLINELLYSGKSKSGTVGYRKIKFCSDQATRDGLRYFWVDTCCIDKSSSAELSEAINSMYRWYEDSEICYVYLADFESEQASVEGLRKCKWFTRGWTLQELLAPSNVIFLNKEWIKIGTKASLAEMLSSITRIPITVLRGSSPLHCTVAQRFSWASERETTRCEDTAYSLLGLFDIQLAPIYGEGATAAFIRLQEMILKRWQDHSIFIWSPSLEPRNFGLLATSPKPFCKDKVHFKWLQHIDDIPTESFDPCELIQPCDFSSWAKAEEDGYVRPQDRRKQVVDLMNQGDAGPQLGPHGLQVSLLWSSNVSIKTHGFDYVKMKNQPVAVCLDIIYRNPTSKGHAAKIILPLKLDVSLGSHSQDTNKRGNFCRISSRCSSRAYRLHQQGEFFKRQSFYISQQNPIPQGEYMAKFTFISLPATATAKLVKSFFDSTSQPSTQFPESSNTAISVDCKGAMLCFYHSIQGTKCNDVTFHVVLGIHGRKPTPWCHISTDRPDLSTQAEKEMTRREVDLYQERREYSTVSKSYCYRNLSCSHVVSVVIERNSNLTQSLVFCVSIQVFSS